MDLIHKMDNAVLEYIRLNIYSKKMDYIMPYITQLGNGGIIWIGIALAFLINEPYHTNGLLLINSLLICVLIGNIILKPLIARIRPCDNNSSIRLLIPRPTDFSFPSGHTMSSFAAATMIFYVNYQVGILAFVIALLIAFSRLYLYVHYPSDVIAGLVIGVIISMVSICLQDNILLALNNKF